MDEENKSKEQLNSLNKITTEAEAKWVEEWLLLCKKKDGSELKSNPVVKVRQAYSTASQHLSSLVLSFSLQSVGEGTALEKTTIVSMGCRKFAGGLLTEFVCCDVMCCNG